MANSNLLAQLRDIHLPPAIGLWPIAWGWYLVVLVALIFFWGFYQYRYLISAYTLKRQLLKELMRLEKKYQQEQKSSIALQEVAFFLKKAALQFYPREQIAHLYGEEWLMFLDSTAKNLNSSSCQKLFKDSLYRPVVTENVSEVFILAKRWLLQQRFKCMN